VAVGHRQPLAQAAGQAAGGDRLDDRFFGHVSSFLNTTAN
jgi:hypothetical protein